MRVLLFAATLVFAGLGACGGSASTGVQLTMTFDSTVSDEALASVTTLVIRATGDDPEAFPVTLGRSALRTESIVYRPASSTKLLGVAVDASAADARRVASGSTDPVSIAAGATTTLSVTLSADANVDAGTDSGTPALGDSSTPALPPAFVAVTEVAAGQSVPLTVAPPPGTIAGTLLLAMVTVRGATVNVISIGAPGGWNSLTTASDSSGTSAAAAWFWRVAVANEQSQSYVFTRTSDAPAVVAVASYTGVLANNPFDLIFPKALPSNGSLYTYNKTTTFDHELVVVEAAVPDDLFRAWDSPNSYTTRESSGILVADAPKLLAGLVPGVTLPTTPSTSRAFTLVTSLRAE